MKNIKTAGLLLASTATVFLFSRFEKKPEQQQRPNILLILADDLGYSDLGCYGGDIQTPNLNNLAEKGIQFTHFYNTARSCPSRASILTGLHPHQTGLGAMIDRATDAPGYLGEINNNCVTLAEVLRSAGYGTYMTGKWHVANSIDGSDKHNWPVQRGFDHYYGLIDGASTYFDPKIMAYDNDTLLSTPHNFYMTNAISDSTVSFLNRHIDNTPDKPFFMYVAYTSPHWPLHALPQDIAKYKGRFDAGWDKLRQEKLKRMTKLGVIKPEWNTKEDDWGVQPWDSVKDKSWEISKMEVYAAMVDCMDQGIGRILKTLKERGELDNTLIIFLADNGGCAETWSAKNPWATRFGPKVTKDGLVIDYSDAGPKKPGPADTFFSYGRGWAHYSNTPFRNYKSSTYEGGISSPFIVYWPGKIKNNKVLREQLAGIIDIMPTLVEVSGAKYPEVYAGNAIIPMEGKSLIGTICNNDEIQRDEYYVEHIGNRGMIEDSRWKVVKPGQQNWQLYDIQTDRGETKDLSGEMPDMTKKLADKWERWAWRAKVLPKPGRN